MSPFDALQTLIAAARAVAARGERLPACRAELVTWCLLQAARVLQPMTLMAMALYHEPRAAFLSALLADPVSTLRL